MANYDTADLIKYQAKILSQYNAGELRVRTPDVFNSLRRGTELMIPSHKEIKNSAKRTTGEVNFFARSSRSLGTGGEIYNHTGAKGDSAVVVPSWTAYDDKFTYDNKQANGSVYDFDDMMMNEMINLNNNFSEGLEGAAVNWVFANRSEVNTGTVEGSFNATNDAFEIVESFSNLVDTGYRTTQITKTNLKINKWSGSATFYCDTVSFNKFQTLANQGSNNSINTSFQYGNDTFIHSVEMDAKAASLSYTNGFWVAVPDGNTSTLDWMPVQNRIGEVGPDNVYGSLIHPSTGLPLATHKYAARADQSSAGSENQAVKTEVQAFSYVSFNHSPLTTADETPMYAYALVP